MEKDAIRDYADHRARNTPAPVRQGVTKGDPIGPGPEKVRAAARVATEARTEKEIAADLGMSEALLRKYCSDPGFRGLVRRELMEWPEFWIEWTGRTVDAAGLPLALGPAAEIALRRAIEKFLPAAEAEWLIRAHRQLGALLRAKVAAGPLPKWVLRRYPNGEETTLYALGEKRPGEAGPLEETIRAIRGRLFDKAEELLDRELSPEQRKLVLQILRELRQDESCTT